MMGPQAPLFVLSKAQFLKLFRQCVADLNLELARGEVAPYHCRHAGPPHDLAVKARDINEVKKRGRWAQDASVKRYAKGGRLGDRLAKLPESLKQHALCCDLHIAEILTGLWPPYSFAFNAISGSRPLRSKSSLAAGIGHKLWAAAGSGS